MKIAGSKKYWIVQFIGWGCVALYWTYYQVTWPPTFLQIFSVLFPYLAAIGYTHVYRNLAHRNGWIHFGINRLFFIVLASWAILSTLYCLTSFLNALLVYGYMNTGMWLGVITGGMRYTAIWLLAFHLYHYSQHQSTDSKIEKKPSNQGDQDVPEKELPDQIVVKDGSEYFYFKTDDIILFESLGNYIKIYSIDDHAITKKSLNSIEERTDSSKFFRANRQVIFNTQKVRDIRNSTKGKIEVLLQNDHKVLLSERKSVLFKELMKF